MGSKFSGSNIDLPGAMESMAVASSSVFMMSSVADAERVWINLNRASQYIHFADSALFSYWSGT